VDGYPLFDWYERVVLPERLRSLQSAEVNSSEERTLTQLRHLVAEIGSTTSRKDAPFQQTLW